MKWTHVVLAAGTFIVGSAALGNPLVEGSAEAGKTKAVTCAACHGPDGNSANPQWPSIAGQNAPYIVKQLQAYKDGTRSNVLMSGQAAALSDEDMRDLAVFYTEQAIAPRTVANEEMLDKGERLYRGGDAESNVAACTACHGPTGRGNPAAAYPLLKGQHATYTAAQLRAYADGQRKSDGPTRIMRQIAARMRTDDIEALASYIQGLK
jgi:cytochrome c553